MSESKRYKLTSATGVPMEKVLTPEQCDRMRIFLAELLLMDKLAREHGKKVDRHMIGRLMRPLLTHGQAVSHRARHAKFREQGLCTSCGSERDDRYKTCSRCRARQKQWREKLKQRRKGA